MSPKPREATIRDVSFGLYSTEDIIKISVLSVKNETTWEPSGLVTTGGLHDPLLGSQDWQEKCPVCHQRNLHCPGHWGHILLSYPVYNPLLFSRLRSILTCVCFKCSDFKGEVPKNLVKVFQLLDQGQVIQGATLLDSVEFAAIPKKAAEVAELKFFMKEAKESRKKVPLIPKPILRRDGSTLVLQERSRAVEAFFAAIKAPKCQHCKIPTKQKLVVDGKSAFYLKTESESTKKYLGPSQIRKLLQSLWRKHQMILDNIFGAVTMTPRSTKRTSASEMFFLQAIPVLPSKFRIPAQLDSMMSAHPQTELYQTIIIRNKVVQEHKEGEKNTPLLSEKVIALQNSVNALYSTPPSNRPHTPKGGIVQLLEKKEGMFRRNMMGKRVNFAARTVISPDPYIETNQIGIPEYFARTLTYPEPVTDRNVKEMAELVINGPDVYPGANAVETEQGKMVQLKGTTHEQRVALSKMLRTFLDPNSTARPQQVLRHVRNGDVVVANRQPTLHKPSMMGHFVKVLRSGEKTLRMHYANCATYNADFDGDEMNLHFPQDNVSRAEILNLALTDNQYLVPSSGKPIRGLIQDHVLTGVLLTEKDTFFTENEFKQLTYAALMEYNREQPIVTPPPAVRTRTTRLWTGKQVIHAVLNHITIGKPPLNLDSATKVPADMWGTKSEEGSVIIRDNELLTGVLDKSQFGATEYGLVHSCYELYGPTFAGKLLSTLSRLFTIYLQSVGFTCGMDDMLLQAGAEKRRDESLKFAKEKVGIAVAAAFTGNEESNVKGINNKMRELLRDAKSVATLDSMMRNKLGPLGSEIIKDCLPNEQVKKFPRNNMSLMTVSGAKGSVVNFSQISCLLGQQELEGKRVPRMVSGRTLPCFKPYDTSARAGGFIQDRFLTGIKPQEYFFHCMAGREGLIDTAVKTSTSGYLQRCIVKHLEGLVVQYDNTVRDTDSSVLQFQYGADCVDIYNSRYLQEFGFQSQNIGSLRKYEPKPRLFQYDSKHRQFFDLPEVEQQIKNKIQEEKNEITKVKREIEELSQETGDMISNELPFAAYVEEQHKQGRPCEPVLSLFDPRFCVGSVSESFSMKLDEFLKKKEQSKGHSLDTAEKRNEFKRLMHMKYMRSLIQPGEGIGVLAAQSIGEPSTQMTLNTFHLAGRGEVNVTLGVPRLREIIMTASRNIKTPSMTLPLHNPTKEDATEAAKRLSPVLLKELVDKVTIVESLQTKPGDKSYMSYKITMNWRPNKIGDGGVISKIDLHRGVNDQLLPGLSKAIEKLLKDQNTKITQADVSNSGVGGDDEEAEEVDDEEAEEEDDENEEQGSRKKKEPLSLQAGRYTRNVNLDSERLSLIVEISCASEKKIQMAPCIKKLIDDIVIKQVDTLSKVSMIEMKGIGYAVQTEGISFNAIWQRRDEFDLNQVYCNDIWQMRDRYGVEAARASIVREVRAVFNVYGIAVDERHVGLVADYMTFEGGCRGCNRMSLLRSGPSPFRNMSFETVMQFLTKASTFGEVDNLSSASSRLVVGRLMAAGTGSFDVLQPLK